MKTSTTFWNSINDSTRKDLVASWVVSVGNVFSRATPHITISNNVRTVAEGTYSFMSNEPKITLK